MAKTNNNKVTVKLTGGLIGQTKRARSTVYGLGLRKVNSVATLEDTSSVRGMINKVSHLVEVVNN